MESLNIAAESLTTPKAAYLHVPFCHLRCPYCSFTVIANRLDLVDRYVEAITRELAALGQPQAMNTLFIGGGHRPCCHGKRWCDCWKQFGNGSRWQTLAKWSIEANPQDIDRDLCRLLRDQGINRISLGGQSFDDTKLQMLGRDHYGRSTGQFHRHCLRMV